MDRESIQRMAYSLNAFSKMGSLMKMSKRQLANLPKEVIIACCSNEIALVWDKLPKHLQDDIDVLKYQYCSDHYNTSNNVQNDVNDGPPPRRLVCCVCNMSDVNVVSDNTVDLSIKMSPSSSTTSHPKRKRLHLNCCTHE